jgi:L-lactate permease
MNECMYNSTHRSAIAFIQFLLLPCFVLCLSICMFSFLFHSLAHAVFIIVPCLLSKRLTKQRVELNYHHHHHHHGHYPLFFVSVSHVVKLVSASSLLYLTHWL